MQKYIWQVLSAAATNGWVLLVGILPIGAAVNLAVYWYNQHPTTRDFQTSEAMVIFVLSLIALFVFWAIAVIAAVRSSNPDVMITRPLSSGLDPQGGQHWFLLDVYNDELNDVTEFLVFLRRIIKVSPDGEANQLLFEDKEDNRSAFIWKNQEESIITLTHKHHELLKIAEEYSVEGENGACLKLFLPPNPNHPYEKHHWLEKIPLDPVNRVDFGIELIMELEIDGKFNGKSIYPRKSNWRLAYKKDDGLVFEDKKPYHRRPKMYDVVFEPISSRQVRSVIKTILPIPPNPDIIIEVIDKDEKAKRK